MKIYSEEALAALESGEVIVSAGVLFGAPVDVGFWGGHGPLAFLNEGGVAEAYLGLGDRGFATAAGGALGGAEQGVELILSGIEPEVAARVDLSEIRGCPIVIRKLIFNGSGAVLLANPVFLRGRVDRADREETPGGFSVLTIGVESAARGLGRRLERMRSDADQRLIDANDGFFARVAYAGEKLITWGGKPPVRAGAAVGGTPPGRGSTPPGDGPGLTLNPIDDFTR